MFDLGRTLLAVVERSPDTLAIVEAKLPILLFLDGKNSPPPPRA
jgi:hypothetical protein